MAKSEADEYRDKAGGLAFSGGATSRWRRLLEAPLRGNFQAVTATSSNELRPLADIGGSNIPHRSSLLPHREYAKFVNPA